MMVDSKPWIIPFFFARYPAYGHRSGFWNIQ